MLCEIRVSEEIFCLGSLFARRANRDEHPAGRVFVRPCVL
jgi:hypothetical protein